MKYLKLLLSSSVILLALTLVLGYDENIPIMFFILAVLHAIGAWESYQQKKRIESILLFMTALFVGIYSLS